jgi:hypothetical protein
MNRWLYADANPVNRIDPSGYFGQYSIAKSLGVSSFDEVIDIFRREYHIAWTEGRSCETSRWGFLRLLQEAKSGDSPKGEFVGLFGMSHIRPIGLYGDQFRCVNDEIWIGEESLQSLLDRMDKSEYYQAGHTAGDFWRDPLAVYHLNGQSFRDGYGSSVPDWATAYVSFDIPGIPSAGVNIGYIVDRYGQAYISFEGGTGMNLSPVSGGYYESYVNNWPWQANNRRPSKEELTELIPGLGSSATLLGGIFSVGGELNWDQLDTWVGTVGYTFQALVEVGILGVTLDHIPVILPDIPSINPDGWWRVESSQGYEEKDIPLQWDSEECGGCF